jgi:branched-chain amino acid transport system substrate-binding protein
MKKQEFKIILGVIGISVAISILTVDKPATAQALKTLKIGMVQPLSGPAASFGIAGQRGAEIAVEEINARGGIDIAGNRYQIKCLIEDDAYDIPKGVAAANKLIFKDEVKFMSYGVGPGITAAVPIMETNKVFSMNDSFSDIIKPQHRYAYRPHIIPIHRAPSMFGWAKKNRNVGTVALLNENTDQGRTNFAASRRACKGVGIDIVLSEYFEPGSKDFYPLIQRIIKSKAEAIEGFAPPGTLALLLKQLHELGYKGLKLSVTTSDIPAIVKIAGKEAVEGLCFGKAADIGPYATEWMKKYRSKYLEKYGVWNELSQAIGYVPITALTWAIEGSGSIDPSKVRDWADAYIGTGKPVPFNPYGPTYFVGAKEFGIAHQALTPLGIQLVKDGELVNIAAISAEDILHAGGEEYFGGDPAYKFVVGK